VKLHQNDVLIMSKILVTGGSGFIGTNVVEHYHVHGHDVISVDISEPRHPGHRVLWRNLDVTDAGSLAALIDEFRPEFVFHFAARTDLNGRDLSGYLVNTIGVANLICGVRRCVPKKIVFASTMLVCSLGHQSRDAGDYAPPNIYGQSKVIAERYIRAIPTNELPWIIVRPTSIWGPWFGVPYREFFDVVRRGYYIHPANRVIRRTFGFVGNTVFQLDQLIRADASKTLGCTFYLGDYEPTEIRHWAELIRTEFGLPPIKCAPVVLMKSAAIVCDVMQKIGIRSALLTTRRLRNLLTDAVYDLGNLQAICGDLPFDLEMSVRLTVAWLREKQAAEQDSTKEMSRATVKPQ